MEHNSASVFYKNRVRRIILPYVIPALLFFVWYNFIFLKDGFVQFLFNLTTVNYWITGDHPTWYVAFAIILYAAYPIIHKLDTKTKHISTAVLIFISVVFELVLLVTNSAFYTLCERALSRLPIFLIGVWLAPFILQRKKISLLVVFSALAILAATMGILIFFYAAIPIILVRYIYGVMGVCIILVYAYIRKQKLTNFLGVIFAWLGKISLEIYVVHVFILRIISGNSLWNALPAWCWYVVLLSFSVLLAKLLSLSVSKINKYFFRLEN